MKEPFLEPLLRQMRIRLVFPVIRQYPDCTLLDIGCGWEARLLKAVEPFIGRGEGIDWKAPNLRTEKLFTRQVTLSDALPCPDDSFDIVTMLAVLEHLSHPKEIVGEIARVLKPGGRLILTVPSKAAKPVLEFLAYKVGFVSEAEIRDHKCYYDRQLLTLLFADTALDIERHRYFQFGMNNYLVCRKPGN
jgi:ubiquinone/menaquinone biosynthesis C-methylase UbiE